MVPAYILSGGRSQRFGSDKARYEWPAGPQLKVLADQLHTAGHAVHIVADRADRYEDLGFDCLVDIRPDCGPLAGLASALAHHRSTLNTEAEQLPGWLLLVSCDQRNWQSSWYDSLALQTDREVDAICYYDTQWQPLPGLYHCRLLDTVLSRIESRQLSLHGLLDSLAEASLQVAVTDPPSRYSFNTPDDLHK